MFAYTRSSSYIVLFITLHSGVVVYYRKKLSMEVTSNIQVANDRARRKCDWIEQWDVTMCLRVGAAFFGFYYNYIQRTFTIYYGNTYPFVNRGIQIWH